MKLEGETLAQIIYLAGHLSTVTDGYFTLWTLNSVFTPKDFLFLQGLFSQPVSHKFKINPGCENLPENIKRNTVEAQTYECVVLYSKENCKGVAYPLLPGYNHRLFSFHMKAVSFQGCLGSSTKSFEPEFTIYNNETGYNNYSYVMPFEKIPKACQNLRPTIAYFKLREVKATKCVVLYKEENCKGESYTVRAGWGRGGDLGSFRDKTKSFQACPGNQNRAKIEYHIRFYEESDFTKIVDDVVMDPGCNPRVNLQSHVRSIESPVCVQLFASDDCTGDAILKVPPGGVSAQSGNPLFTARTIQSIQLCSERYYAGPNEDQLNNDVVFNTKTNFESWSFAYHRISTTCQNVHWHYVNQAEAVINKKCLYLFEKPNCEGTSYRVHPGNHSSLNEFKNKMISFKACSQYDNEIEHHAMFYANGNFTALLDDVDVYESCSKVDLRAAFSAVDTPVCLDLYSDDSCSEGHNFVVVPGRHSLLPNRIHSLRPCNVTLTTATGSQPTFYRIPPIDSSDTTSPDEKVNERTFNLKAIITSFKVTSDENAVRQITKTSLGEMGQRTVFRNDGPAIQTQRYSTQKTISDRVDLEMVKGLSEMSEVSVSDTATKDFTSGFRSSLNIGFTERNSSGGSSSSTAGMETGISGTVHASTTATAGVNVGIASASASATAGFSTTAHLNAHYSATSQNHQEYSSERSAYQTEEKNVEERIGAALTSGYRNTGEKSSSKAERKSKEESRTFSIDQTITVNPCTEYEVTSYVKKTENFPSIYTTFANITGIYDDDESPVPVEEIKTKLAELELEFIEDLDNRTVLAKGSAKLTLDFSWYSVWNGKGNLIEGCHDGTDSHLRYPTIAFFVRPYLKGSLRRTKLTGSCQILPIRALNKVQSVDVAACVILFPTETCKIVDELQQNIGYSLLLKPNEGRTLPYFANVSRSFQSCEGYSALNLNTGRVQFYSEENDDGEPLVDSLLTNSCKDLPHSATGKVLSVASRSCITLFSESQCHGSNFTVRPFSAMKLKNFFQGAASFKPCPDIPQQSNFAPLGSIKLYGNVDKTNLLLDSSVRKNCVNLRSQIWNRTVALTTETCVIIFQHPFCQGSSVFIQAGEDLPDFNLKSFIACDFETANEQDGGNNLTGQCQAYPFQLIEDLQKQNKEKEELLEDKDGGDGGYGGYIIPP